MSKTIILAGAHIDDYSWLGQQITQNDFVICADSGARHAHAIDIIPDMIVGDMDSISSDLMEYYADKTAVINDDDQNKTDMMKALDNCDTNQSVEIFGAVGQRADHDFSNYLILKSMPSPDNITLRTPHDTRRIITKSFEIKGNTGDKIGIFPMSPIKNMHFSGLKFPAHALNDAHDFGWNGACNELTGKSAKIEFDTGIALITHSHS